LRKTPAKIPGELFRAVVLAPAYSDSRIGGIQRYAGELNSREVAVEVGPRDRRLNVQTPDASICADEQLAVPIKADAVIIGMGTIAAIWSIADVRPVGSAIGALDEGSSRGELIARTSGVDDIGVGRINCESGIVPTLTVQIIGSIG